MTPLELLAPAKNLECGIAAIDHGADAVYIGPPSFGARAMAGNSVADIAQLCNYAHKFEAKVYATVNTIIYDDELPTVRQLLQHLQHSGVDAVLIQDMALLEMRDEEALLPNVKLQLNFHASTQTDNRSVERVRWLRDQGFSRVVLARELSIEQIRFIHNAVPDVELEVFVHGALCVSYSGQCYISQYCFHRSANRGECAQFCRMPFDLTDADGHLIEHNSHLLSLKDLCQINNMEALIEAGATSFKIEGRLKDIGYVKNVTAAYSERLNQIVRQHPDLYCRASRGCCRYTFTPNLQKTFNRGYTDYFAHGRQPDIASFNTPKAIGEYVGTVKELRHGSFNVAGTASFTNGDGLCFLDDNHQLKGFRINRAEGNRLYPQHLPEGLHPGQRLYRNNDQEFERLLSRASAERKIPIKLSLQVTGSGFSLASGTTSVSLSSDHIQAEKPQHDNIVRQLTKLGNTPFECTDITIPPNFSYFIPSSQLSELRHRLIELLSKHENSSANESLPRKGVERRQGNSVLKRHNPHLLNIANQVAAKYYGEEHPTAYELHPQPDAVLMQCRHCLRYALGYCVKHGGKHPSWHEPLFLQLSDGRKFQLEFDCANCQMNVYASRH